jgi:hypothetical protein
VLAENGPCCGDISTGEGQYSTWASCTAVASSKCVDTSTIDIRTETVADSVWEYHHRSLAKDQTIERKELAASIDLSISGASVVNECI